MDCSDKATKILEKLKRQYTLPKGNAPEMVLELIGKSYDSMWAAEKAIEESGHLISDRWGVLKVNPAYDIIKDSKNQIRYGLKALGIEMKAKEGKQQKKAIDSI
jgi:phage terminase small subunit